MNYNEFEYVVTNLYNLYQDNERYLDSVPYDVREFIMGNYHVENVYKSYELMAKNYFGEFYEDVSWFIYDCTDSIKAVKSLGDSPNVITRDGTDYWINDLQSYLDYVKIELFNNGLKDNI